MPRFAANLGFLFPEHAFLDRFGAARHAGFEGVEFASPYDFPPGEIAARLAEHALECVLFNLPMGDKARGDFGIACRPERVDEFRAGVARALEYAALLGPARINCIAGLAREGEDRARLRTTLVGNLRFAADALERAGVGLVVEPINTTDVPGFFVPRAGDAAALIAEVAHANVGLQLDLYHTAMMGEDPAPILAWLRGVIRHIQFADVPGRGEPGSGTLPLQPLFDAIDRMGYAGWVSAEYRPSRQTELTLDWMHRSS